MKTSLIANAVSNIPELVMVKTQLDTHAPNFGMTDNDFLQYFTLLLRAAATLDVSRGVQSSHARTHKVHSVDFIDGSYDDSIDDTDTYEVHAVTRNPKATLPLPTWKAISSDGRAIWDQLSDADKAAIIAAKPRSSPTNRSSAPRQAHVTDCNPADDSPDHPDDVDLASPPEPPDDNLIIHALTNNPNDNTAHHPPGSINRLLGKPGKHTGRKANNVHINTIRYNIHSKSTLSARCLIDRGANGSILGTQMRIIETYPHATVDITGIDDHELTAVPLGAGGTVVCSNHGFVIVIVRHGAILPTHKSILSSVQMEAFKIRVHDTSPTLGGLGTIATPEGYVIPLTFHHGLAYLADARPYTDHEWASLPHVFLTQETEWNPTKFDYVVPQDWYTKRHDPPVNAGLPYDDIGVFRLQHLSVHYAHFPTKPSFSLRTCIQSLITAANTAATRRSRRLLSFHPTRFLSPLMGSIHLRSPMMWIAIWMKKVKLCQRRQIPLQV